jgi:hypothetical protein
MSVDWSLVANVASVVGTVGGPLVVECTGRAVTSKSRLSATQAVAIGWKGRAARGRFPRR